jgi:hypothetical protein
MLEWRCPGRRKTFGRFREFHSKKDEKTPMEFAEK